MVRWVGRMAPTGNACPPPERVKLPGVHVQDPVRRHLGAAHERHAQVGAVQQLVQRLQRPFEDGAYEAGGGRTGPRSMCRPLHSTRRSARHKSGAVVP